MMNITVKSYTLQPICEAEVLRYAGCKSLDEETSKLIQACITEAKNVFNPKICFCKLPCKCYDNICSFKYFDIQSSDLAKNLSDCDEVLLFAATIGIGIDRLISRYSRLSPSKALIFQAIGAERIEMLCDTFCKQYCAENSLSLKPRFSPGYGNLSISCQHDIFRILDCNRKIGLSLNDSMMMSPTKSVTAFAGIVRTTL